MIHRMRLVLLALLVTGMLAACGAENPTAVPADNAATNPTAAPAETTDTDTTGAETSGDAIPIGVAVAQTSNVSLFGQEQVIGARIAEDYFNANGGINGRPIRLIFEDTAGDEAGAINAFQNLINQHQVVAIVGPTLSQQAFSADPIAVQNKVPVVGPSNTAPGIPQIGEYVSRVSAPVTVVAPNAIRYALDQNPEIEKVVVLFAQNDAFSKSETTVFQRAITETYELDLAAVQTFQTTDTDFTTQVSAVLNENPDLVIISGLATDGGNLVKQLRELGYTGTIIGGNGFNTPNIFQVCQQFCDGIIVAQAYSTSFDNEINDAFSSTYMEQQGKEAPQFSAQSFAAVQVIVEALRTIPDLAELDLAALRTELNQQILAGTYETPLGTLSFTPEGDINQSTFYVAEVEMNDAGTDGEFVLAGSFAE